MIAIEYNSSEDCEWCIMFKMLPVVAGELIFNNFSSIDGGGNKEKSVVEGKGGKHFLQKLKEEGGGGKDFFNFWKKGGKDY